MIVALLDRDPGSFFWGNEVAEEFTFFGLHDQSVADLGLNEAVGGFGNFTKGFPISLRVDPINAEVVIGGVLDLE